jgi:tryptophan-rich sensory protein
MNKIHAFLIAIITMLIVMYLPSGVMKSVNTAWYRCIRSDITPPNYVFPIVWTLLYILIGIVFSKILLLSESKQKNILLFLFVINLILNVSWSFAYFGLKNSILAYIILLFLIGTTLMIIYYIYKLLPLWVIYLYIPYYLWICFALVLSTVSIDKIC